MCVCVTCLLLCCLQCSCFGLLKAKFHYVIMFEAGQLRTSFEPASVMEFGFDQCLCMCLYVFECALNCNRTCCLSGLQYRCWCCCCGLAHISLLTTKLKPRIITAITGCGIYSHIRPCICSVARWLLWCSPGVCTESDDRQVATRHRASTSTGWHFAFGAMLS